MVLFFAGVILFRGVVWLIVWYGVVFVLILLARLPFTKIFLLSLYPVIFGLVFAFSSYNGNWVFFFFVILKVVVASSTMLLFVSTTPYPRIFGSLGRVAPSAIIATLFLIYRSIFILLDTLESLYTTMKLRGGFSLRSPIRSLKSLSRNLGYLMIKAVDISERMYEIMELRGFDGRIRYRPPAVQVDIPATLSVLGFELLLLGLLVLALR